MVTDTDMQLMFLYYFIILFVNLFYLCYNCWQYLRSYIYACLMLSYHINNWPVISRYWYIWYLEKDEQMMIYRCIAYVLVWLKFFSGLTWMQSFIIPNNNAVQFSCPIVINYSEKQHCCEDRTWSRAVRRAHEWGIRLLDSVRACSWWDYPGCWFWSLSFTLVVSFVGW